MTKERIKNKRTLPAVTYFAITFVTMLILNSTVTSLDDDLIFARGIDDYGSIIGWAVWYGINWGGRLIPHGLLVLLLQLPNAVFIIINAAMYVALIVLFLQELTTGIQNGKMIPVVAVVVLLFIPNDVCQRAMFWKCASVLYLWGLVAVMLQIRPLLHTYRGEETSTAEYIFAYAGCIYVSGFEQLAAFAMVFSALLVIINLVKYHRLNPDDCAIAALSVVATCFFVIVLPGNSVRSIEETIAWQPAFASYSIYDKLIHGISFALNYVSTEGAYVILLIAVAETAIVIRRKQRNYIKIMALSILAYYLLNAFKWTLQKENFITAQNGLMKLFTYHGYTIKLSFAEPIILITSFIGLIMFIMVSILSVSDMGDEKSPDYITPLLLLGGFGTLMIMGFSPTIAASETRTQFPAAVLWALSLIRIAECLRIDYNKALLNIKNCRLLQALANKRINTILLMCLLCGLIALGCERTSKIICASGIYGATLLFAVCLMVEMLLSRTEKPKYSEILIKSAHVFSALYFIYCLIKVKTIQPEKMTLPDGEQMLAVVPVIVFAIILWSIRFSQGNTEVK